MSSSSKARFSDADLWIRFLYMVLFALLTVVARFAVCAIALVQFLLVLFSGEDNRNLRSFGNSLSLWTFDAYRFLTFNSEQKPFPFMDWPEYKSPEVDLREPQGPVPAVVEEPVVPQIISDEQDDNDSREPKM